MDSKRSIPDIDAERSQAFSPAIWFVGLLFIAFVSIDVGLYSHISSRHPLWTSYVLGLTRGTVVGQTALVGLAIVWVRANLPARILFAALCLPPLAYLGAAAESGKANEWFGGLVLYLALILMPLFIARLAGVRVSVVAKDSDEKDVGPRVNEVATVRQGKEARRRVRSEFQFTVFGLLGLMTLVAIGITLTKFVNFPILAMWEGWPTFVSLAGTALVFSAMPLYRWCTRVSDQLWLIALLVTLGVVSICLVYREPAAVRATAFMALLANAGTALFAGIVLRMADVRFGWRQAPR